MGEQNKPQEGKPLTAEEEQHCGTHRDIMVDLHRREMEHDGAVLSFKKGFNEGYALAAKDKRQDLADHEKATAALREELERWKDKYEVSVEAGKVTNTELEAVKKELQGMKDDYHDIDEDGNHIGYGYWKDEYFRMQESARKYLKQRDEVTRQRDEAVDLLTRASPHSPETSQWQKDYSAFLSRLSSGETKPAK